MVDLSYNKEDASHHLSFTEWHKFIPVKAECLIWSQEEYGILKVETLV